MFNSFLSSARLCPIKSLRNEKLSCDDDVMAIFISLRCVSINIDHVPQGRFHPLFHPQVERSARTFRACFLHSVAPSLRAFLYLESGAPCHSLRVKRITLCYFIRICIYHRVVFVKRDSASANTILAWHSQTCLTVSNTTGIYCFVTLLIHEKKS